jgi:hypothetical protein
LLEGGKIVFHDPLQNNLNFGNEMQSVPFCTPVNYSERKMGIIRYIQEKALHQEKIKRLSVLAERLTLRKM